LCFDDGSAVDTNQNCGHLQLSQNFAGTKPLQIV
jgi:hypothetical protein